MNVQIRRPKARLLFTILILILSIKFLFDNQKDLHTQNEKTIFYFQGKPGLLFFTFFACTIAVYFYALTKKEDHGCTKKWALIANTICFLILLPLQVFSMDSYFYLSDKEVVESSFWELKDKQKTSWDQLKKATLFAWGSEKEVTIGNSLTFLNGKTYNLDLSSMGKTKFIEFIKFLHSNEAVTVESTPLSQEQSKYICENLGLEILELWEFNKKED